MKNYLLFLITLFLNTTAVIAQTVVLERVSDLKPEIYAIEGTAILQSFDNGEITLSLSDDYDTDWGPDVRILLSNSLSLNGAIEIVNLTDINHFNGARTFDVPSSVDIDDFQFILFFCVQFNQFWASGEFGAASNPNGITCTNSAVSGDGESELAICSSDGNADMITLSNSLNAVAGDHYAYLITDEDEILQEVVLDNAYDFEASTSETQRVYGVHFDGELNPLVGANRLQTTASICFEHSNSNDFLTITKNDCTSTYECLETITATTNWVTQVNVCTTDGTDDIVELRNNAFVSPGDHYAFLITDESEVLQEVVFDTIYNFEGTGTTTQRVYGISFDGTLNMEIGQNRLATTATGCFIHSGDNVFLTIDKSNDACLTTQTVDVEGSKALTTYPNPSSDVLNINLPEAFVAEQISIINLLGAQVLSFPNNNILQQQIQINVADLDKGNYILRVENSDQVIARKIQILR